MAKQKDSSAGGCRTLFYLISFLVVVFAALVVQKHYEHPEPRLPPHYAVLGTFAKIMGRVCLSFPEQCKKLQKFAPKRNEIKDHVTVTHVNVTSTSPEVPAGDIPVHVFTPKTSPAPNSPQDETVLFYIHGGGWVLGTAEQVGAAFINFATKSGFTVVGVDYRLAPEFVAPAAIEDVVEAYKWTLNTYKDKKVVAIGDSAGGNLAASLSVLVRDRDIEPARLTHQILVYPVITNYTHRATLESGKKFGDGGILLDAWSMQTFEQWYNPTAAQDPRINLLLNKDLKNLPPAMVITAELDVLRSEGLLYASLLEEAGVPVERYEGKMAIHGFMSFPVEQQQPAIDAIFTYLQRK